MDAGIVIGLITVGVILALAAHRPLLAWLGTRHAFERPRQFALVVAGLMVATAVLTGAGVVADSMSDSVRASSLEHLGATDVTVTSRTPFPSAFADTVLADARVAPHLAAHATALRVAVTAEHAANGLGEPRATVWGVDPAAFPDLAGLRVASGALPATTAWDADTVILNWDLARRLAASPGDEVRLFVKAPPRPEPVWNNATGTLTVAAKGPDGAYTHAPGDEYAYTVDVPAAAFMLGAFVIPDGPPVVDFDLEAVTPSGATHLADAGTPTAPDFANLTFTDDDLEAGTWTFRVHAKDAANASYRLAVLTLLPPTSSSPVATLEGVVAAVVADAASDPVAPGPVAHVVLPHLQAALGAEDGVNVILAAATDADARPALREGLMEAAHAHAEDGRFSEPYGTPRVRVTDARGEALEDAEREGEFLRVFFLTFGTFSILAGLLLIVSLMGLLVEERKGALATLRATGAQRADVTRLHVHEVTAYAAVAAVAGVVAGVALAAFIVAGASSFSFYEHVDVGLHLHAGTLLGGAGAGFAVTVLVAGVAAHRVGRFNVARVLRGEDEPAPRRLSRVARLGYAALVAAGLALLAGAAADGNPVLAVAGPPVLVLGVTGLLAHRVPAGIAYPAAGALLLAYVGASFFFLTDLEGNAEFALIPLRGLLLTIAGALVLVYLDAPARVAAWGVARVKRLGPVVDAAFAYARGRRARTLLTVSMVGLVVLILVAMSSVYAMFAPDPSAVGAGFDVVGTTQEPVDDPRAFLDANPSRATGTDPFEGVRDVTPLMLVPRGVAGARVGEDGGVSAWGEGTMDVVGATPAFAERARFRATALAPGYADAGDVLADVAARPDLALVSNALEAGRWDESRALEVGDEITLPGARGDSVSVTVAGVLDSPRFAPVIVHPDAAAAIQGEKVTRLFIRTTPDADPEAVARRVEAAFRPAGMDAVAAEAVAAEEQAQTGTQLVLMQTFIGLGLVIGVTSVGIVTTRNVMARRREIGVLRALGADVPQVMAIFVIEVVFVVTLAVLIGLGGGLLTAYGAYLGEFKDRGAAFVVNWGNLFVLVAIVYGTAVTTAVLPARTAARFPPAEATRGAE